MTAAHIRIDDGVKRGRRPIRKGLPTRPSHPADLGTWVIPKDLNPQEVLDRYLTEQTTAHIAKSYGLSRKALVKWIRTVAPEQWKEVQLIRAHVSLEQDEDGMREAPDALSLARMRECVKAAQFRLQALDPDYRPKQEVMVEITDLGDKLRRARERVIDAEQQVTPQIEESKT